MYIYQSTNPCLCTPTPMTPLCPDDCNCIKLCNITLNARDPQAVGPCGVEGTLDLLDPIYEHDLCACGTNQGYWSIETYDKEIFVTVAVDPTTGVLTYITQGPDALLKQYGAITLKYCCGYISAYMCVIIGIADLCNCPTCGPCNECDPCTGICLSQAVDVSVQSNEKQTNTNVNASNI